MHVGSWFRRILSVEPNLAIHKPAQVGPGSDRDDLWSSKAAIDGLADDVWVHWSSTVTGPQWLQIDLQKVYPFDYINVITFYDGNRCYRLNDEASADGKTWHKVLVFSENKKLEPFSLTEAHFRSQLKA